MTRLLVAVAALVAVVGCGGVENEPNLAAAIEKTEAAGSSLFEVAGTEKEDGRTIEIVCRGKADYERARLQMSCDYGRDGALEAILVDESTYMRGEILGFAGAGTKWTKFADAEARVAALAATAPDDAPCARDGPSARRETVLPATSTVS